MKSNILFALILVIVTRVGGLVSHCKSGGAKAPQPPNTTLMY